MAELLVFSGTSEGRQFAEAANAAGIRTVVFVATEYGEIVMHDHPLCEVRRGRLGPEEMKEVFASGGYDFIVDATHPYAVEVTANIRQAAADAGAGERYIRLSRERSQAYDELRAEFGDIEVVPGVAAARERLHQCMEAREGNVLLTTGVRELACFMEDELIARRLYARMLPSVDSLNIAFSTDVKPGRLICMEGPFDTSINEAMFRWCRAAFTVTKNSGKRGGFREKLTAAKNCGVHTIIIDPGQKDEGFTGEQILSFLGVETKQPADDPIRREGKIYIAGIGVGREDHLTIAADRAIRGADLLIGARRMLEFGRSLNPNAVCVAEYAPEKVAAVLEEHDFQTAVILMSGDTGFFSGTYGVNRALGGRAEVLCGISSLSYFASKTGVPYSESSLMSLHGQDADVETAVMSHDRLYSILTGPADIRAVCDAVVRLRGDAVVRVGFDLGAEDEEIFTFPASDMPEIDRQGLYIMCVSEYER